MFLATSNGCGKDNISKHGLFTRKTTSCELIIFQGLILGLKSVKIILLVLEEKISSCGSAELLTKHSGRQPPECPEQ